MNEVEPIVTPIAKRLSDDWPGQGYDDIRQHVYAKLVERWNTIATHADDEREGIIRAVASKEGVSYCSDEHYSYRAQNAEWIYTPKEVRTVLREYFFDHDGWTGAPTRDDGQSIMSGGICVALWDITEAYEGLTEKHQALILRAFRQGERLTSATDRKELTRAVDAMTKTLNRFVIDRSDGRHGYEGPGGRTAISNARAGYMTDGDY